MGPTNLNLIQKKALDDFLKNTLEYNYEVHKLNSIEEFNQVKKQNEKNGFEVFHMAILSGRVYVAHIRKLKDEIQLKVSRHCDFITKTMITSEKNMGINGANPHYPKWKIGYCAHPSDIIGDSEFGFYRQVEDLAIAKEVKKHFTNLRSIDIPYERKVEDMSIKYIVARFHR